MDGGLRAVPASRAGLFADRALPLADKRSLGRFMAACMEAVEGSGRLKVCGASCCAVVFCAGAAHEAVQPVGATDTWVSVTHRPVPPTQDAFDGRPLVDLLVAEGLNERLQAVVLYGIAMADVQQQQQPPEAAAAAMPHGQVTAAQGLAALELYSRSLGRHGGSGAFMAPCYGSGSLTEAFVRLAAVKGAVTALRHAAQQLELLPGEQKEAAAAAAAREGGASIAGRASTSADDPSEPAAAGSNAAAAAATAPARVKLVLASGQALTAGTVISSASHLTPGSTSHQQQKQSSQQPQGQAVARAVAVLDRSLVEGDTSLLLVMPPGTLGPEQAAVIRGLQLGHALAVAPPGNFLLYLSAFLPDGADAAAQGTPLAEQVLRPALEALAALQDLQPFGAPSQPDGTPAATSSRGSAAEQGEQQQQEEQDVAQAAASSSRARALAACFYVVVHETHEAAADAAGQQHIVRCASAPAAGFAGFTPSIAAAEALFRQHFPDLPWLTEPLAKAAAAAAAGGTSTLENTGEAGSGQAAAGGAADYGGVDDDELDAIDELTAALADLSAGFEPDAPPHGSS
jgi:hypothetical protein